MRYNAIKGIITPFERVRGGGTRLGSDTRSSLITYIIIVSQL